MTDVETANHNPTESAQMHFAIHLPTPIDLRKSHWDGSSS